jgi:hypothetical protein
LSVSLTLYKNKPGEKIIIKMLKVWESKTLEKYHKTPVEGLRIKAQVRRVTASAKTGTVYILNTAQTHQLGAGLISSVCSNTHQRLSVSYLQLYKFGEYMKLYLTANYF